MQIPSDLVTAGLPRPTEAAKSPSSLTNPKNLGKDQFLQLLVTQLKNQNPLDPMKDTEFIAQLAQFSSLEQLVSIREGVTKLTETGQPRS